MAASGYESLTRNIPRASAEEIFLMRAREHGVRDHMLERVRMAVRLGYASRSAPSAEQRAIELCLGGRL